MSQACSSNTRSSASLPPGIPFTGGDAKNTPETVSEPPRVIRTVRRKGHLPTNPLGVTLRTGQRVCYRCKVAVIPHIVYAGGSKNMCDTCRAEHSKKGYEKKTTALKESGDTRHQRNRAAKIEKIVMAGGTVPDTNFCVDILHDGERLMPSAAFNLDLKNPNHLKEKCRDCVARNHAMKINPTTTNGVPTD